jgi:RHS repeat-associated protein
VQRGNSDGSTYQNFYYDTKSRFYLWEKKSQTSSPQCVNVGGYGYDCTSPGAHTDVVLGTSYDNVENPTDLGAVTAAGNRLTAYNGFTMTYDADGFLVKKVGATTTDSLVWDAFGQLQQVIRGGTVIAAFSYDGFGRRVKKTTPTATVQYVWDGDQVILEADGTGATTQAYTYYPGTDRLHSVTAGGQTYYASIEPSGDVNGLIKATDNSVAAQYAYTPWGELETNVDSIGGVRVNSLRWKGLVYDKETGLYYMRARYYDPTTRRFVSEDPIGLEGGINEYVFGSGDPVNRSDPTGLDDCKWVLDPGAFVMTYDVWNGNQPVWVQPPRLMYECTEHMYEDPAARVGRPNVPSGQTTGGGQLNYHDAMKYTAVKACPAFLAKGSPLRNAAIGMGSTRNGANESAAWFRVTARGLIQRINAVLSATNSTVSSGWPPPPGVTVSGHVHPGPYNTGVYLGQGPSVGDSVWTSRTGMTELIVSQDSLFWINPGEKAYGCAR